MSRRVKTLLVPVRFIYSAFLANSQNDYVIRREIEGIPPEAKVANVWYCADRHAFQIAIEHDTFEEVEECNCAPVIVVKEIAEVSGSRVLIEALDLAGELIADRPQTSKRTVALAARLEALRNKTGHILTPFTQSRSEVIAEIERRRNA